MWKTLSRSVQGIGHRRGNIPCQDSCQTNLLSVGDHHILILTASDGAGSAERSDIGSRIACESAQRIIVDDLIQWGGLRPVEFEQSLHWYQQVMDDLQIEAEQLAVPLRQLACTLLVSIIGESGAVFCQIGDGAMVTKVNDQYEHVFWPQSGEYANTTNFITAGRLDKDLMFEWRDGRIDDIAIFTDGLQSVALDFAHRRAHEPFFSPLFKALNDHADPSELQGPMQTFLESPSLAERTDDDLTLILATRIAPHDAIL